MQIQFVQNLIDKLRNKININDNYLLPWLLRKKINLENKKIKTLVLGSSHLAWGYNCNSIDVFNLASANQDLYYTYNLYRIYNSSEIKNILLDYSVFTPCYNLIKTNDYKNAAIFKAVFGIDYIDKTIAKNQKLYEIEKPFMKYIKRNIKKFQINPLSNGCET